MMTILLINQYYPPDVAPTGCYLHDLARQLVGRGHDVTVIASRSAYHGSQRYPRHASVDGITVQRVGGLGLGRGSLLLKTVECGWFLVCLATQMRRLSPVPDFALSLTTPPFVGALVRACKRRQTAYGHWIMDLYPDVLYAHGMLRPAGWPARRLAGLARYAIGGGVFAVGLGDDMAARLQPYAGNAHVEAIPLWPLDTDAPDADAAQALRRERGWQDQDLVMMYSGNMGRGHRFGEFLAAAQSTAADPAMRWVFAGGGMRRGEVEQFAAAHPEAHLELQPYVDDDQLTAHLLSADVHLMSLDKRWEGCMIPSKVQAICQRGRPILFVGGRDNNPARWIEQYEAGWVVDQDDTVGMQAALKRVCDPSERSRRGANAQRLAREQFDADSNRNRLCDLIEQTEQS